MPHVEGHIEEPQVQGDPQGVDYNAIFEGYYSEGYNEKQAKRMLRATYGAEGKTQFDSLGDFYKKKKSSRSRRSIGIGAQCGGGFWGIYLNYNYSGKTREWRFGFSCR